jgi:hypothetical protein
LTILLDSCRCGTDGMNDAPALNGRFASFVASTSKHHLKRQKAPWLKRRLFRVLIGLVYFLVASATATVTLLLRIVVPSGRVIFR